MKPLLIFGDSWPHGAELKQNELTYGELLAVALEQSLCNFSQPSTSIPHLILQLRDAISQGHRDCAAVFFLSGVDRDLVWENNTIRSLSPAAPSDADWYAKYNSPELSQYRVNVTLIALQLLCAKHNIDDHYIWGWDTVELWPDVDLKKIYPRTIAEEFLTGFEVPSSMAKIMYLKNSHNPYIWPNQGHPNQLGHQRIADLLQEWICT